MREIESGTDRLETGAQAEKAKDRRACRGCTVEETRNLHQEDQGKPSQSSDLLCSKKRSGRSVSTYPAT